MHNNQTETFLKGGSALKVGLPAVWSPVNGLLHVGQLLLETLAEILLQLKNAA